jgi:5-methylcytosine-specific restriction endonuclease McrA
MANKSKKVARSAPPTLLGALGPEDMKEWARQMLARKPSKTRCGPRPNKEEVRAMKIRILERDGNDPACFWCGARFPKVASGQPDFRYATLEHIVPLYLGGKHVISNCVFACMKCNSDRDHESLEPPP